MRFTAHVCVLQAKSHHLLSMARNMKCSLAGEIILLLLFWRMDEPLEKIMLIRRRKTISCPGSAVLHHRVGAKIMVGLKNVIESSRTVQWMEPFAATQRTGMINECHPQIPRFGTSHYLLLVRWLTTVWLWRDLWQIDNRSKSAKTNIISWLHCERGNEIKKPLSENRSARNQLWGMMKGFITRSTEDDDEPVDLWYESLGFPGCLAEMWMDLLWAAQIWQSKTISPETTRLNIDCLSLRSCKVRDILEIRPDPAEERSLSLIGINSPTYF